MDGHESSEELNTEHLEDNDNGPNNDESWVGVDSLEDVKFVIDFSGANHVENLHKHKQIEDDGQVTGWSEFLKSLIHFFLLLILDHTNDDIETTFSPLFLKGLKEIWILGRKCCFNLVKSEAFFSGSITVVTTDQSIVLGARWSAILFSNESRSSEKNGQDDD